MTTHVPFALRPLTLLLCIAIAIIAGRNFHQHYTQLQSNNYFVSCPYGWWGNEYRSRATSHCNKVCEDYQHMYPFCVRDPEDHPSQSLCCPWPNSLLVAFATIAFVSCILAGFVALKTVFQDFGAALFYTSACGVLLFAPLTLAAINKLQSATDVCQDTRNTISKWHMRLDCVREWFMDDAIVANASLAMLWLLLLCISGMFRTHARRGPSVQDPRSSGIEGLFSVRSPWSQEIQFSNKMRVTQEMELSRTQSKPKANRSSLL